MEPVKHLWTYHWTMPLLVTIAVIITISVVLNLTMFKDKIPSKLPDHYETGLNADIDSENKAIQQQRRKATRALRNGLVIVISCVYLIAHFMN